MWKTLTEEHINYCFHHAFGGGGVEPVTPHPP